MHKYQYLSRVLMLGLLILIALPASSFAKSDNMLLGKPAAFSFKPNYALSVGNDAHDLTDGKVFQSNLFGKLKLKRPWTSASTVTWMMKRKQGVLISFDLETIRPVNEVTISANSGSDVVLPLAAYVYSSLDGQNWEYQGNLVHEYIDQTMGPVSHIYKLNGLNTRGRYLQIYLASAGFYMNIDEIEAYSDEDISIVTSKTNNLVTSAVDDAIKRLPLGLQQMTTLSFIKYANKAMAVDNGLTSLQYRKALDQLKDQLINQPTILNESDEELGIPYTSLDRQVTLLVGEYFSKESTENTLIWNAGETMWSNRTNPFVRPQSPKSVNLSATMSKEEIEPIAFNLTNNTPKKQQLDISINNLVNNNQQEWPSDKIDMRISTHVVGANFRLYDDPLHRFNKSVEIEPGMTRQIWVFFNSKDVADGTYIGKIVARNKFDQSKIDLNLSIKVYSFAPKHNQSYKSMSWAYFSKGRNGAKFPEDSAAELKRAHNTVQVVIDEQVPWPIVDPKTRSFKQPLELDFTNFDEMMILRPEVNLWLIWPKFEDEKRRVLNYFSAINPPENGSVEHQRFVKDWIRLIRDHMNVRGYSNDKFAFYWYDEVSDERGFYDIVVPFSKLAKEVDPSLNIFETHKVSPDSLKKHLSAIDIHVITTSNFKENPDYAKFFRENPSKIVWHYKTDSNKSRDPIKAYRLHHSYAFLNKMSGAGYWTWIGEGGQWKDPLSRFPSEGMVYMSKNGPVTSKRREAWREGIEDVALWNALVNTTPTNNSKQINNIISDIKDITRTTQNIAIGCGSAVTSLANKKAEALNILSN